MACQAAGNGRSPSGYSGGPWPSSGILVEPLGVIETLHIALCDCLAEMATSRAAESARHHARERSGDLVAAGPMRRLGEPDLKQL